jgi:hypothetical protein
MSSNRFGPEIDIRDIKLIGDAPLGRGCFGEVWRGEVHFNKVAVKIPLVQHLSEEELEDLRRGTFGNFFFIYIFIYLI